ncbi:MAG: ABC transporter substrate-binding protein [Polyangiaceae bacterium]|nr:ABC transporter substrate-binding protein [Polyangiaceae bacterium]MCL4751436.1 ABC transporter substrate-binding protein [Myxococcales bacterium]
MSRRRWFQLLVVLSLLLGFSSPALADDGAEAALKAKQNELAAQLKKGKAADGKKMDQIFDELLDYDTLAKDSLGSHWDERSDAEKKEFQDVLKRLVKNAYRKNLKKTLNYEVTYEGVLEAKKGVLVKTVAKNKTNSREEPVHIDYAMHKLDGRWVVGNIVTEGASLVGNYRSQFGRVIKKNGFAELMRRMKKKADKEGA